MSGACGGAYELGDVLLLLALGEEHEAERRIEKHYEQLLDELDPHDVTRHLVSQQVLSLRHDLDYIDNGDGDKTKIARTRRLLKLLVQKSSKDLPQVFLAFTRALEKAGYTSIAHSLKTPGGVYRILLTGNPGSGKSTTGNTILGKMIFAPRRFFSNPTLKCQIEHGMCAGRNVEVMDTPYISFYYSEQKKVYKIMAGALVENWSQGPHVVLHVVRADSNYTSEEEQEYMMIKQLLGEGMVSHVIVVFTAVDQLSHCYGEESRDYDKAIHDALKRAPETVHQMLRECGNRYVAFTNEGDEATKAARLEKLFSEIDKLLVQNGFRPYTLPAHLHELKEKPTTAEKGVCKPS